MVVIEIHIREEENSITFQAIKRAEGGVTKNEILATEKFGGLLQEAMDKYLKDVTPRSAKKPRKRK